MNRNDAKKEVYRIAAEMLGQDEPDALYVAGDSVRGYSERSVSDYGKLAKAWQELIRELQRRGKIK